MLEAKLAGEEIKRPEPVAETPVVDLMEALRRSVADAQGRQGDGPRGASQDRREEPARKPSQPATRAVGLTASGIPCA